MTTEELHEILDDENKKITLQESEEIIYKLKQDCLDEMNRLFENYYTHNRDYNFYRGEVNAFQVVLDLLEHIKGE